MKGFGNRKKEKRPWGAQLLTCNANGYKRSPQLNALSRPLNAGSAGLSLS